MITNTIEEKPKAITATLHPSGEKREIELYKAGPEERAARPGLGFLAFTDHEGRKGGPCEGRKWRAWYYKAPSRGWVRLSARFDKEEAPPLPQLNPHKCGCSLEPFQTCGGCGKPYWIELHGVATGHCSYCYYHG